MRKTDVYKKISFGIIVAAFLLLAVIISPVVRASSESGNEIYLSAGGSDENDGTQSAPFATLDKAIDTVADGGTIHISGVCYVRSWTHHGKSVNIVGNNPVNDHLHFGEFAPDKQNITIGDNVSFSKVRLRFPSNSNVFANGFKVTIAEDAEAPNPIYLYGGSNAGTINGDTNLTVLAGIYNGIYGGGKGDIITGNTNLVVGGKANPDIDVKNHNQARMIYGGGRDGSTVQGSANLTFTGNAKAAYIFGGASGANTSIKGGSFLKIAGGSAVGFFGGGKGSTHNSDVNVLMTGGTFEQVFGGSHSESVTGNVDVQILGGTITRRVYGGCYNEYGLLGWNTEKYVNGSIILTIGGNANITLDALDSSESLYDDRSIYACSRFETNDENTTLIFAGETARATYDNDSKLGAQDDSAKYMMSGIAVCDNKRAESDDFYSNIAWWRRDKSSDGAYTTYPEKDGYLFAGWYSDTEYTTAYKGTKGSAYAKYVDAKVLSAKKQLKMDTTHQSSATDVRFLTSIDTNKYQKAGFDVIVEYSGNTKIFNLMETTVYNSVIADGQTISDAKSVFDNPDSNYFVTHKITGIPNAAFDGTFSVTPYWYTLDGTKVSGSKDTFVIRDLIKAPESETQGMDGVISDNEYKGKILDSTKGSSASIDYKVTAQGYITEGKNIRLAITMDSTRDPNTIVNPESQWSEHLFVELGFGNNNGETCTKICADVLGKSKDAVTVVKTTDKGEGSEGYRYNTVVEMWIPKEAISDNPTPNMVQFTRCALFHQNFANPTGVNETWLVLRSAWNNAGMNNCYVTTEGIVTTDLLAGMDGVIGEKEYRTDGDTTAPKREKVSTSEAGLDTNQYSVEMYARLLEKGNTSLGVNAMNMKIAFKIDSAEDPSTIVNKEGYWSKNFYVEVALGSHDGIAGDYTKSDGTVVNDKLGVLPIYADVLGNVENAISVVKTTSYEGENANYKYTTVIEMWVPARCITNVTYQGSVYIPRVVLYHSQLDRKETWLVSYYGNYWNQSDHNGLNLQIDGLRSWK